MGRFSHAHTKDKVFYIDTFLDALASLRPIMDLALFQIASIIKFNNVNIAYNVNIANNVCIDNNVNISNNVKVL